MSEVRAPDDAASPDSAPTEKAATSAQRQRPRVVFALLGFALIAVGIGAVLLVRSVPKPPVTEATFTFDDDNRESPPQGFEFIKTGEGPAGVWTVQARPDAPSPPHVLTQTQVEPGKRRFLLALAPEPVIKDLTADVWCLPLRGEKDQGCGIAFRYQNPELYYLARLDALDGSVRLYLVTSRGRQRLGEWSGHIDATKWHRLRVHATGDRMVVYMDDFPMVDVHEPSLQQAGKVGLWTKSDSVVLFDDFRVIPYRGLP